MEDDNIKLEESSEVKLCDMDSFFGLNGKAKSPEYPWLRYKWFAYDKDGNGANLKVKNKSLNNAYNEDDSLDKVMQDAKNEAANGGWPLVLVTATTLGKLNAGNLNSSYDKECGKKVVVIKKGEVDESVTKAAMDEYYNAAKNTLSNILDNSNEADKKASDGE